MLGTTNAEDQKQLDALDSLLEKNPYDIKVLMKKAFILYYCFRDDEAVVIYKKIIEIAPNFIDAYFWMAECMWDHLANFDEAIAAMHTALKLDPSRADCHEVLAWCIKSLHNDTPEYFYHIHKVIELEPTWITPRVSLIESLINLGNFIEALQELNQTFEIIKNLPVACDDDNDETWDMSTHYEWLITGRTSTTKREQLKELQQKIDAGLRK